jgi:hypothetical protein
MRNKTLTGRSVLAMPENGAKYCQVYGHSDYPPRRTWHENRARPQPRPGVPPMMFAPMELAKKARAVRHKSTPFQTEERVPSRYLWRRILVIVLGAALIKPAAAQIGIGTAAAGFNGSVMSQSLKDIAAVLVVAVVYLYELCRILNLCQFAAPIPARSAEATNESAQPPRHGTAKGLTGALGSMAKKSSAEMSLPGALISLSGKFG